MITFEEYPVYNHKQRPGIGKDLSGQFFYNCFTVKLSKGEKGSYAPYLFTHFIRQYSLYAAYSDVCTTCIAEHKIITLPIEDSELSIFAAYQKFNPDMEPDEFYYCPLIRDVLLASTLHAEFVEGRPREELPAEPMPAIYVGSRGDNLYLFEFKKIAPPQHTHICPILAEILTDKFISSRSERSFFILWFLAMFYQMETTRQTGYKIFLEEGDFELLESKLYNFLFPIPQAWVNIIPKPPPRVDWQEWEAQHRKESIPQRVDFLFIYDGKRHIIEIDDIGHYGVQTKGGWIASESQYRQTLSNTRWLRMCGYEVHRFTSEEILELYNPESNQKPDVLNFIKLLRAEGLEPRKMVFL